MNVTGLNCTTKKLHEFTKLYEGTKLHKNKIIRMHKIARSQICTRAQNCTKTILHQGSTLNELHFRPRVKKIQKKVTDRG